LLKWQANHSEELLFIGRFRGSRLISLRPTFEELPLTPDEVHEQKRKAAEKSHQGRLKAASDRKRRRIALEVLDSLTGEHQRQIRRKFRADRRAKPTLSFQDWLVRHLEHQRLTKRSL
jgi:hypothetical protein